MKPLRHGGATCQSRFFRVALRRAGRGAPHRGNAGDQKAERREPLASNVHCGCLGVLKVSQWSFLLVKRLRASSSTLWSGQGPSADLSFASLASWLSLVATLMSSYRTCSFSLDTGVNDAGDERKGGRRECRVDVVKVARGKHSVQTVRQSVLIVAAQAMTHSPE